MSLSKEVNCLSGSLSPDKSDLAVFSLKSALQSAGLTLELIQMASKRLIRKLVMKLLRADVILASAFGGLCVALAGHPAG